MDGKPDVLVLGGGGVLGETWMTALLAGLEEATGYDLRECEGFVGTSAGSIVAAALVAGKRPQERLDEVPEQPSVTGSEGAGGRSATGNLVRLGLAAGTAAVSPAASLFLRSTTLGGAFVRRVALNGMPRGRRSLRGLGRSLEQIGARFDGRLTVSAVDLQSGRRVMFGSPEAPDAGVGEAVEASCAIPGVFSPIEIGGRAYVDGGAWSPTNMDTVDPARGTRVLCLNPTGSISTFGPVSRAAAGIEALVLERRGAEVKTVSPDAGSTQAMGGNLMDARPRREVAKAAFAQGLALGRKAAA